MRSHALPLAHDPQRSAAFPLLAAAWLVAVAIVATTWAPLYAEAFHAGTLVDNDDAMRLVQVRAWMAGQGWFDLTQARLNPPDSPIAHWSRLVDVPIALLIRGFGLVLAPDAAERAAIVAWPTLLGAGLILAMLAFARRLFTPIAVLAGGVVIGFNLVLFFQVAPGRIDHHGVQMLLTLALCVATARAVFDHRPPAALAAGGIAALMIAIGLETIPFVAIAAMAFGLAWIVAGDRASHAVRLFGLALAATTALLFVLTVPPQRWTVSACDAISPPWLWLAIAGGGVLAGLGFFRAPDSLARRAGFAAAPAIGVAVVFLAFWSDCLRGPYAALDPLTRKLWFSGIGEARPTLDLVRAQPAMFLFFLAFPVVGWIGLVVAALKEWRARPVFLLILAFASAGLAVTLFQMRGAPIASLFGFYGCLYLLDLAVQRVTARPGLLPAAAALVAFAVALPFGWSALGSTFAQAPPDESNCGERSDFDVLAAQPPGLVLAPVELGPRILVATGHSVIAAPYHRNIEGNRLALEALSGDADKAHRIVEERGVRYVALCPSAASTARLAAAGGSDFVNALLHGPLPAWLAPLPDDGAIRAWQVVPGK